ncbi:methylthioribulose 1-phosphate dehydratase [Glaciibacter psychrotolerans]|uniref:Methylthioribulose-1-phosphate dehydratase n=1 Tax=Glaciibacter psychrotolerans TaxID=670054 RepID=A0A7Z0J7H1_9MICO|nr:methylthioribulose 1-phosphate dehydratase [Leifsonia psychrotolerans]NYJ21470.1 methylthioribulose-1-phosphate dehydratase [Leifsonia psychrotolerans]
MTPTTFQDEFVIEHQFAPDGITDATLTQSGALLASEAARFASLGWMRGTSGNLSVTLQRDPLRLAVTGSGLDKGELNPLDFVIVDADGDLAPGIGGSDHRPSAEAGLHARIARVTGAGAVVHVHALAAVVAAEHWPTGVELRDLEMLKGIGHAAHDETVVIPVIPNDQDMVVLGDAFEAAYVRPTAENAQVPAILVGRHGMYAWGADMNQARWHAELIEWLLRFKLETR